MEPMQPIMEQPPKAKSVKISTPIGEIESDSGNHLIDVGTVVLIILIGVLAKKYLTGAIKWK